MNLRELTTHIFPNCLIVRALFGEGPASDGRYIKGRLHADSSRPFFTISCGSGELNVTYEASLYLNRMPTFEQSLSIMAEFQRLVSTSHPNKQSCSALMGRMRDLLDGRLGGFDVEVTV